jgi:hypothetical protein
MSSTQQSIQDGTAFVRPAGRRVDLSFPLGEQQVIVGGKER